MTVPLSDNAEFQADLESTMSSRAVAEKWRELGYAIGKSSVNDRRKNGATAEIPAPQDGVTGSCEGTSAGGEFKIQSSKPLNGATDWADIFVQFERDPDEFEIVDDTVSMKKWQQSKGLADGTRDLVTLYSYGAKFTRKVAGAITDADIAAAQKRLRAFKLNQRIPGSGLGAPVAAVCNLSDMQAWKPESDGINGLLDRVSDGLENFNQYVKRQRATGRNIDEVVIVNNGDPFEGIAGNYSNQLHTVKAGLRQQMNTVLDVWEMYARELYPQFDKGQFITVHCNHTQFGRQGGAAKSLTGDEDTGSAFLAESLQRILRGRAEFDHVKFTIPHDEMNVYADIAGVPVAFNHGHKIPGSDAKGFETWLNGQVRGDTQAYKARIWITAHKHHFASWDMGSTFVFQCPSCEKESKWLRDISGRFSRSGILAMLIGEHEQLGWSDTAFL